jgi:hypothetical protein
MVDFEEACKGLDKLVNEYKMVAPHPALKEHTTDMMYLYVNNLKGEAGLHKQKLIQDYKRRTRLIDDINEYLKEVKR